MNQITSVPFFRPELTEEEINEVVDSLRNGWLTTGPKARKFETDFAEYVGGGVEAVAVNSATSGLHLALEAIGVGPGDEVIVPNFTFTATAEVVRYLGAHPVFVDVDERTFNLRPADARFAITERTKAIMPVHFAGLPCDMHEFMRLSRETGIAIVEDAAHTCPAKSGGVSIGKHGSAATVFSFYANKTITTGEGGMLVTADPKIAARARVMRLHGIDRDALDRFKTGDWQYDIVAPGYKYNMPDTAAAIGIHQLRKADRFLRQRSERMARYRSLLSDLPLSFQADAEHDGQHSWHLAIARLLSQAPMDRDELFEFLRERGIVCSIHYTPLHRFAYWRETYNLENQHFPVSERLFKSVITLPLFPSMTDEEQDYVVAALRSALGDGGKRS